MVRLFYSEYGIENIARRVLTAYDARLYYGQPSAIPIEDLIEANGLSLEYQYLRKNGRILGKTIFDDGLEAVYDMERHEYTLFPVRAGTILVDASSVKKMPVQDGSALPAPTSWRTGASIKSSIWAPERVRR